MFKNFSFIFIFFAFNASSAWYEVTGVSSFIIDENSAREKALESAIFQALRFSNADIATLENVRPYLKEIKDNYYFTGNEIREIQIIESETKNETVTLTVRIDIYPAENACHKKLYKKRILLSNFNILNPQQAALGSIFEFGSSFTQVLKKQFNNASQSFIVQEISPYSLSSLAPQQAMMIAQENNVQYILYGNISDMTATIDRVDKDISNRQLAIDIFVVEGQTGNVILKSNYRNIAIWDFDFTSKIDTKTARFWTSAYGQMAQNMSKDILLELENKLACHMTTSKVIAIENTQGMIDIGRNQGVQKGDELALWHQSSFIDQYGVSHQQLSKSNATLTVIKASENTANIEVSPSYLAGSIQIGDVALKAIK